MDRASTPSLTAKRAEVRLMSPYWKSTWWVVVGDLLGLLVPPVLQAPPALPEQPEPPDPQDQQAQPEQPDRPDRPGQRVRPERQAQQALQVPPGRLEQPVSLVPLVQLERRESRVIREPLAPPDRPALRELPA